jgi:hypothetical protein
MEDTTWPTLGNGKICYVEIPAVDIKASAAFYQEVRERGKHSRAHNISHLTARGKASSAPQRNNALIPTRSVHRNFLNH